jgi:hypothetical protein
MNKVSKIAPLALLAWAAAGAVASANVPSKGPLIGSGKAWTERAATQGQDRLDAPRVAPEGCAERTASNRTTPCPAIAAISRTKAPVRVIQIYTVTPVAVCVPDAVNSCIARR